MTVAERLSPILGNLAENAAAVGRETEKRIGHLSELAYATAEQLAAAGETSSPFTFFPAASALLAALPAPPSASAFLTDADRAHLSLLLLGEAEKRLGRRLTPFDFADGAVPPPARSRTVYVKNPHAETAYRRFVAYLASPTAVYRDSFRELFDDVENGYAEYAVLPLFSDGVRIASVARMIEEYGHAIVAVTTVPTGEGEAVFALLSRRSVRLFPPTLYFFCSSLRDVGAAGLLTALPILGLALEAMDPLPPSPGRSRTLFGVAVRGEERAFVSLLVYLSLFLPGYLGGGFYFELD